MAGDAFRGPSLVAGGGKEEARGILETKREIKELREKIVADRGRLFRLAEETAGLEGTIDVIEPHDQLVLRPLS